MLSEWFATRTSFHFPPFFSAPPKSLWNIWKRFLYIFPLFSLIFCSSRVMFLLLKHEREHDKSLLRNVCFAFPPRLPHICTILMSITDFFAAPRYRFAVKLCRRVSCESLPGIYRWYRELTLMEKLSPAARELVAADTSLIADPAFSINQKIVQPCLPPWKALEIKCNDVNITRWSSEVFSCS